MDFNVINTLAWAAQDIMQEGAEKAADAPPWSNPMFLVAAIFALFYFLILRPQKREQKQRQQMTEAMKKGDRVVSAGGIHGTIESIDTDKGIVTVTVAPKINMKFQRASITQVVDKDAAKNDDATDKK